MIQCDYSHLRNDIDQFRSLLYKYVVDLARSQSSLKAARTCLDQQLYDSAASRAYFAMFQLAMFQLAISALEARGIKRSEWTHKGVHGDFVQHFVRGRKVVPANFAGALPAIMEIRHLADYRQPGPSQRQVERAVRMAEEFSACVLREVFNASNS